MLLTEKTPSGSSGPGSSARWDSPPQELEQPTLYQPSAQSHGQEVILVSLLPPQAGLVPVAGWEASHPFSVRGTIRLTQLRRSSRRHWGQWGLPSTANQCGGGRADEYADRGRSWLADPCHLPLPPQLRCSEEPAQRGPS